MIKINPILVSGTEQQYCVTISEKLCHPYCISDVIQPRVSVDYEIAEQRVIEGILYVTIRARGTAVYVPKNGCPCNPKIKVFTETETIAFVDVKEPTAIMKKVAGYVKPSQFSPTCCSVAQGVTIVDYISIAI